jgi:hypothetical protein
MIIRLIEYCFDPDTAANTKLKETLANLIMESEPKNKKKGIKNEGGLLPLGYAVNSDGYFEIDPRTAPIVLDIFKLYQSGMTLKEVAAEIERRGVKSQRGKAIPPSSITKILRNRKYIGEYGFKDIVQPGVIPVIVPRDLFDAVQERLNKNTHAPARFKAKEERYLLSEKTVRSSKAGQQRAADTKKGTGRNSESR